MSDKSIDNDWKNRVADERRKLSEDEARQAAEAQAGREAAVEATFLNFLSEYAMRAMVLLGLIPYPGSEERVLDLTGARFTIDILGVIEEKTKGNLTPEEEKYLRTALYELRMRFVDVSEKVAKGELAEGSQAGPRGPKPATGSPRPGAAGGAGAAGDAAAAGAPKIIVP